MITFGFLLMVSLDVSATLQAFSAYMASVFPARGLALKALDFVIVAAIAAVLGVGELGACWIVVGRNY